MKTHTHLFSIYSIALVGSALGTPLAGDALATEATPNSLTPPAAERAQVNVGAAPLRGRVTGWGESFVYALNGYGAKFTKISAAETYSLALTTAGRVAAWGYNSYSGACEVPEGLEDVVDIAAGFVHSLALKGDGTVVTWGTLERCNDSGMRSTVPDGLGEVTQVAAGFMHNLVLRADRTVRAWGEMDCSPATVPGDLRDVIQIAAGWDHALALKSDGTVVAWGRNAEGQSDVPVGLSGVIAVSAGYSHSLALTTAGTVVAWGELVLDDQGNDAGPNPPPPGLRDVVAISAGAQHCLALGRDGAITAWGRNTEGQCDVPPGLSDVTAIAAGASHSLALRADGNIVAWGLTRYYKCVAPQTGPTDVVAIATSPYHSLAVRADGAVRAWGDNSSGQLDVPSELGRVVAVAAGYSQSLALQDDGIVIGWGDPNLATVPEAAASQAVAIAAGYSRSLVLREDGTVVQWGNLWQDELPMSPSLDEVVAISAGFDHYLALRADGSVVAWGSNQYGQCDPPVGLNRVVAISAGTGHNLALHADGTVVAWGFNNEGQCDVPLELRDVKLIIAGPSANASSALKADGTIVEWGYPTLAPDYPHYAPPAGLGSVTTLVEQGGQMLALIDGNNRPPLARSYALSARRNGVGHVSLFDLHRVCSDPDLDAFIVTDVAANSGAGGRARISGGTILYITPPDFAGPDSFAYTVRDSRGASSQGTVQVTVSDSNGPELIRTLFNTGVDSTGNPLPDGTIGDRHYVLTGVPAETTQIRVRTSAGSWPIPPYVENDSLSAWIGPNNDPSVDGPVGRYVYRTTFELCGFDPATAHIDGQWSTDNESVDILLNGVPIRDGVNPNEVAFVSWTPFTISSEFVSGVNTLDFIVHNDGGPTAMRVEMLGTAQRLSVAPTYHVRTSQDRPTRISVIQLQGGCADPAGDLWTLDGVSASTTASGTASIDGSYVVYTPAPGYIGTDLFTYTLRNWRGVFLEGSVSVTAVAPAALSDLNNDGCVDRNDLALVMSKIQARSTDLTFDLNGDGQVDVADARFLVLHFTNRSGSSCLP